MNGDARWRPRQVLKYFPVGALAHVGVPLFECHVAVGNSAGALAPGGAGDVPEFNFFVIACRSQQTPIRAEGEVLNFIPCKECARLLHASARTCWVTFICCFQQPLKAPYSAANDLRGAPKAPCSAANDLRGAQKAPCSAADDLRGAPKAPCSAANDFRQSTKALCSHREIKCSVGDVGCFATKPRPAPMAHPTAPASPQIFSCRCARPCGCATLRVSCCGWQFCGRARARRRGRCPRG